MAFEGLTAGGAVDSLRARQKLDSNLKTADTNRQTQDAEIQMKRNEEAAKYLQESQDSILEMINTGKSKNMSPEEIQDYITTPVKQHISFSQSNQQRGAQVPDLGAFQNSLSAALLGRTDKEQMEQDAIINRMKARSKEEGEVEGGVYTAVNNNNPKDQFNVRYDEKGKALISERDGSVVDQKQYNIVEMGKTSGKDVGSTSGAVQNSTAKTLEEKLIDVNDSIANLDSIAKSYDKKFLQLPAQAELWFLKNVEKLGVDLTPEQEESVKKISVFKRRSIAAVNSVIKEITGAQMSELEAKRIRKQVPDPEIDAPSEYIAKLEDVTKMTKLARARYKYMLANGFEHDFTGDVEPPLSLEDMESVMDDRVIQLRKLGMKPVDIRAKMKEEFEM